MRCTSRAYRQMRKYLGFHASSPEDLDNVALRVEDAHHIYERRFATGEIENIIRELSEEELQAGGSGDDVIARVEEIVQRFTANTVNDRGVGSNLDMVQLDPGTTANEIKVAMTMTEKSPRITHAGISAAISKKIIGKGKGND